MLIGAQARYFSALGAEGPSSARGAWHVPIAWPGARASRVVALHRAASESAEGVAGATPPRRPSGATLAKFSIKNGLTTYDKWVEGSIVNYENLDNYQMRIHDYFKFLKYGYDRVSDWSSLAIRRGRMSRKEAVELSNQVKELFDEVVEDSEEETSSSKKGIPKILQKSNLPRFARVKRRHNKN